MFYKKGLKGCLLLSPEGNLLAILVRKRLDCWYRKIKIV